MNGWLAWWTGTGPPARRSHIAVTAHLQDRTTDPAPARLGRSDCVGCSGGVALCRHPPGFLRAGGNKGADHFPQARGVAVLRRAIHRTYAGRLWALYVVHARLRPAGCLPSPGRAGVDAIARRLAECAYPLLPACGIAELQCYSARGRGCGAGVCHPHLHQPGLEPDFCVVSVVDHHPQRSARSQCHLSLEWLAAFQNPGTALRRRQPDLEQHDELGRRLVLPDGGRDLYGRPA